MFYLRAQHSPRFLVRDLISVNRMMSVLEALYKAVRVKTDINHLCNFQKTGLKGPNPAPAVLHTLPFHPLLSSLSFS